jgi:WD40 repeat protein
MGPTYGFCLISDYACVTCGARARWLLLFSIATVVVTRAGLDGRSDDTAGSADAVAAAASCSGPLLAFTGHELTVQALALSPHNGDAELCSGSRDNTVRVWDTRTEALVTSAASAFSSSSSSSPSARASVPEAVCKWTARVPLNIVTCLKWIPGEDTVLQVAKLL